MPLAISINKAKFTQPSQGVVVASGFGSMTEPEETLIKKAEDEVRGHKANRLCSFTQGPLLTSTL